MANLVLADMALGPAFAVLGLAALIAVGFVVALAVAATVLIVGHLRKKKNGTNDDRRGKGPTPPGA